MSLRHASAWNPWRACWLRRSQPARSNTNSPQSIAFLVIATADRPPTPRIQWKSNEPVWVEQWPLSQERLAIAHELVKEQLQAKHIQPSLSPWNTPIFVIPKKSGKWRLLHDLRKVNNQMWAMGALQPGMPSPTMLPQEWYLLVIDLKDCFFTIPLQKEDTVRFAFTLPSINKESPSQRFEWVVLPQGMKNSPTMCQLFVHWALTPVRAKLSQTIIYHYMDDILFCQRDPFQDDLTFITAQLAAKGLVVAPEKIQRQAPWKYLGWILTSSSVHPQKLELITEIHTLNDAQRLVEDLQWVRSIAGIRNDEIATLMSLLKGTDPQAPITLLADQKSCLIYLGKKLLSTLADRRLPDVPLGLLICNHSVAPCAIIFQWPAWQKEKGGEGPSKSRRGAKQPAKKIQLAQSAKKCAEPLAILEWIFTPYTPPMSIWQRTEAIAYLIKKARTQIVEISGAEPEHISLPITIENLEWMLRHSEPIQLQTLELTAVAWALSHWRDSKLNIVSDSLYVVGVVQRIEDALIKPPDNKRLCQLFFQIKRAIEDRNEPCCIIHIHSHQTELGLGKGNAKADTLVSPVVAAPRDSFAAARESHALFHQAAKALQRQFNISLTDAQGIVKSCPQCSQYGTTLGLGVNPRGLQACEI
ncbi:PREDICTED: endogenous retrovirus group K member 11 Pol protein-like [Pseudopodoces humilis]|uniref:endogenous retrovirus group K member 11 Pol protein-like n=1 Tax=Pseudopodoces humilis TaxID=181119 RepID=UPI0006B6AA74|nr:PREDICTED: endogenous retrovirus group K member 11 Pol protein-like [Pseudopodoces humilis]